MNALHPIELAILNPTRASRLQYEYCKSSGHRKKCDCSTCALKRRHANAAELAAQVVQASHQDVRQPAPDTVKNRQPVALAPPSSSTPRPRFLLGLFEPASTLSRMLRLLSKT
ncbi:uncharacterized protein EHS24_001944 [Apiotrichum porosum]|uniref:Uncharacterized protein n=1 Tax=Apiotrichum porosum TaxID=105984 RepID=A0A427XJJ7_9TREE|nr:uncharacterized protein EHS24_001944 [Apiotrichum porosum]RSH79016.1 hypothetical protein EHS24_001944 [Apiotrichum porosum]